jgi:glyoxalase superfamily protein
MFASTAPHDPADAKAVSTVGDAVVRNYAAAFVLLAAGIGGSPACDAGYLEMSPVSGRRSSGTGLRVPGMAIARFPSFVIDCPDPGVLANFYAAILDWKIEVKADWADLRTDGQCISFQRVEDYTAPQWPGQQVPQQMHLDVVVADLDAGEAAVLELGATKHEHQPGTTFRVFLDPAGHPFCLCLN